MNNDKKTYRGYELSTFLQLKLSNDEYGRIMPIFEYEEFTMESFLLAQQHHFVEIFGIIDGQLVNTLQQTIIDND